jgi:GTP-binding protein HflX
MTISDENKISSESKVILVKRASPNSDTEHEAILFQELKELARSAGYLTVGKLTQTRFQDSRYQLGKGKIEELAEFVRSTETEML